MHPDRHPLVEDHATPPIRMFADWRDFAFLHFAVEPAELAPHVPYPLDLHDGRAYVSLVSFRLERLRPSARWLPAPLGRWLMRPVSDHAFLNVRTYVRGPAGVGIHFIAEWINNPLSVRCGPLTYGLPYRLAEMDRRELAGSGLQRITVRDRDSGRATHMVVPVPPETIARECAPGSLDAFLLERYTAYTHCGGRGRWFVVEHPRWRATPFQLARFDTTLLEAEYPWFRRSTFVGGHLAEGFADIAMSAPRRLVTSSSTAPAKIAPAAAAGR
jgi:uncharacterized protein YqjF (DUF2071 family)